MSWHYILPKHNLSTSPPLWSRFWQCRQLEDPSNLGRCGTSRPPRYIPLERWHLLAIRRWDFTHYSNAILLFPSMNKIQSILHFIVPIPPFVFSALFPPKPLSSPFISSCLPRSQLIYGFRWCRGRDTESISSCKTGQSVCALSRWTGCPSDWQVGSSDSLLTHTEWTRILFFPDKV